MSKIWGVAVEFNVEAETQVAAAEKLAAYLRMHFSTGHYAEIGEPRLQPTITAEDCVTLITDVPVQQDVYMSICSGGGDTYIKLLDKETWDWCRDPKQPVPDIVQSRYRDDNGEELEPITGSSTAVNDAFLSVSPIWIGDDEGRFDNARDAFDWAKKHNLRIVETFEGSIY